MDFVLVFGFALLALIIGAIVAVKLRGEDRYTSEFLRTFTKVLYVAITVDIVLFSILFLSAL
jgi:hypothetical protein